MFLYSHSCLVWPVPIHAQQSVVHINLYFLLSHFYIFVPLSSISLLILCYSAQQVLSELCTVTHVCVLTGRQTLQTSLHPLYLYIFHYCISAQLQTSQDTLHVCMCTIFVRVMCVFAGKELVPHIVRASCKEIRRGEGKGKGRA